MKSKPRKQNARSKRTERGANRPLVHSPDLEQAVGASFPIVGVGASAGGLETFSQLLKELPSDTGMAFVFIQHLDPTHTSFLAEAIAKATGMPVVQAEDNAPVEPDHVYVIPPNADVGILRGRLTLIRRRDEPRKLHLPIDFFFRALAADRGSQAIGLVLSGTASDGTEGLRAIKEENGITLAQDPKSAKFGGMPHSAISAGVVDYARTIPDLAQELIRLSHHPYFTARKPTRRSSDENILKKVAVVVRNLVGVDFSEYKAPTFERRLARRMALRRKSSLEAYLDLLQQEPEEVRSLYEDILIHVTSFFRDPDVYDSLKAKAYPEIVKRKPEGAPVRAWVAGCSTGEEVYSLAISLLEFLGDDYRSHPIQVFGSDVSERSIEKARQGVFSDASLREVSDERRRRYFTRTETGYRISKSVRDLCVFVRHDLARDPPFSKVDLVSCRNVLIYFDLPLQRRVLQTLHYALTQPGYLLLGRTENISGFGQFFSPVDKNAKLFARTPGPSELRFAPRSEVHPLVTSGARGIGAPPPRGVDLGRHLDRMLLAQYSPPGVLINDRLEVLQFRGDTGAFLKPAPGEPQTNLLKMARPGLLSELRATIACAKKTAAPARAEQVDVEHNGLSTTCDISVTPFTGVSGNHERLFLVMFEGSPHRRGQPQPRRTASAKKSGGRQGSKAEQQLAATKEYLQTLVEDHGRTNEDLNAANEELISGNEELQSMNEELETAKEELQSTNEELTTVNEELHSRNEDVNQINSDLVNLLSTVDTPIIILDLHGRIRRFTPKAETILNILPSDVGRPLQDIRLTVEVPHLNERIAEVLDTNLMHESEVQAQDGRWYRMRIRPYRTTDNRMDGATVSIVDIDSLKKHLAAAQDARAEAERANQAKDQFLATLSHELRTPLSSMLMHAQLLRKVDMDPKVRRAGEAIERGTKMQAQLIEDLLDVSRITAGKLKIVNEPVDLLAVVRAAVEGARVLAERRSVELAVVLDHTLGRVSGDPTRLQQVVSNLLNNAIKFTPERGKITLTLESCNGHALLRVSDTGMGIHPTFLPHVFSRFTQEDGTSTRAHSGLGLGLSIVRHLVEAHGGTVKAESEGPGKGATFTVTLPLLLSTLDEVESLGERSKRSTLEEDDHENQAMPALDNLRVLVVDDDLGSREAVADLLGQTGAQVRVAESAADARRVLLEFAPAVLLCDLAMPSEDGFSFIRKLRSLGPSKGGDVPALALTALAGEDDRQRALAAGFQLHLAKPVDPRRLALAIAELSQASSSGKALTH